MGEPDSIGVRGCAGQCSRCRISYAISYSRVRCEICGGTLAATPQGQPPRWEDVRASPRVPQVAYDYRVAEANRHLTSAAASAFARFKARHPLA